MEKDQPGACFVLVCGSFFCGLAGTEFVASGTSSVSAFQIDEKLPNSLIRAVVCYLLGLLGGYSLDDR